MLPKVLALLAGAGLVSAAVVAYMYLTADVLCDIQVEDFDVERIGGKEVFVITHAKGVRRYSSMEEMPPRVREQVQKVVDAFKVYGTAMDKATESARRMEKRLDDLGDLRRTRVRVPAKKYLN